MLPTNRKNDYSTTHVNIYRLRWWVTEKNEKITKMKLIPNMLSEALIMSKENMRTERKLYTKQSKATSGFRVSVD